MIRSTSFVHLTKGSGPDARDRLVEAVRGSAHELDVLAVDAAPTAPVTHRGGDLMILAAFRDLDAYETARRHPYATGVVGPLLDEVADQVESVRYEQGPVLVQEPGIERCVQRTLLLRVDPAAGSAQRAVFEHELGGMARYIDAIRNSSLSHVGEVRNPLGPTWTHVWEQEFATLDGLTGPYMQHAYHWAHVDTWFDPQSPNHIVDTTLIHAACDLRRSILALARPDSPQKVSGF